MDLTPNREQAIYVASVTPAPAMFAQANDPGRDMPDGLEMSDLNFLNPDSKLFNVTHVMSSAGQVLLGQNKPCVVSERNRTKTVMIADSGGFQIISGVLKWEDDQTREHVLRWQEDHADWAMTLDIPTRSANHPKSEFKTFNACLETTLENLDYIQRNRNHDKPVKFLNVLQGETSQQANKWFEAVKHYPFEGWAFAGLHRFSFANLCRRIIQMADENLFDGRGWIHVLGTNRPSMAIALTALQRAINKHIPAARDLRISYDTSSPFRMAMEWRNAYSQAVFDINRAVLQSARMPDSKDFVGSSKRFPWRSPIGDRITMGDLCVKTENFATTRWDDLSFLMLVNHNYSSLLLALEQAHRIWDMGAEFARTRLPSELAELGSIIDYVIETGTERAIKDNLKALNWASPKPDADDASINEEER